MSKDQGRLGTEKKRPTLSLCMIVKNEEEMLPGCLESVKDAVDEMIIVDTGSSDRTIQIAKSYGARVYSHPWRDSFSEARNYGLQFATGDWILQLDADERLEQEDIALLRRLICSDDYDGIIVGITNFVGGTSSKFYYERVFRRGKGHYEGIVHNQLVLDGACLPSEIRIYHYGYDLSPEKMQAKWKRTTKLLKKQIADHPKDAFARFNLVRNYRSQRAFQQGIEEGCTALEVIHYHDAPKIYLMIVYETANCLLRAEAYDEAEHLCLSGLARDPQHVDLIYTLASLYLKEERYPEAIEQFERFLEQREEHMHQLQRGALLMDTLGDDYTAHNGLGLCYYALGARDKAVEHFERAIVLNPRYGTAYRNLSLCYQVQGDWERAVRTYEQAFTQGVRDADLIAQLAGMYAQQGQFDQSGRMYYALGDYANAIEACERHVSSHPMDVYAWMTMAHSYAQQNQWTSALMGFQTALAIHPELEAAQKGMELVQRMLGDS